MQLTILRHGQSEANEAVSKMYAGEEDAIPQQLLNKSPARWQLTEEGIQQAQLTGEWLRENEQPYQAFFTSEFDRALHTAALLNLEKAEWVRSPFLHERSNGDWDVSFSLKARQQFHQQAHAAPYYHRPPGGETMADVAVRLYPIYDRLLTDHFEQRVIIVCHGAVMCAFEMLIDGKTEDEHLSTLSDHSTHYRNCHLLQYIIEEERMLRRSFCPYQGDSPGAYQLLQPPKFTSEQLLSKFQ